MNKYVETIQSLKDQGVSQDEVLDVLDFDSDQYPDPNSLNEAVKIVYKGESNGTK